MFKKIEIKLSGPICNCDEQSLSWNVGRDKHGSTLSLECKSCATQLIVPHSKFVASFDLERPYPGKKDEPKDETKPDGAKVIDLFTKKKL